MAVSQALEEISDGRTTLLKLLLVSRVKQLKIKEERNGDIKDKDLADERATVYPE